jgi:hypothetical protein
MDPTRVEPTEFGGEPGTGEEERTRQGGSELGCCNYLVQVSRVDHHHVVRTQEHLSRKIEGVGGYRAGVDRGGVVTGESDAVESWRLGVGGG